MALKIGKPFYTKDRIGMTLLLKDQSLSCPLCRCEFSIMNDHTFKNLKPLQILGRVWFGDAERNPTICHQITDFHDAIHYLHIKDFIRFNIGKIDDISKCGKYTLDRFLENMFGKKQDIHIIKCECNNKDCVGIVIIPEEIYSKDFMMIYATPKEFYTSITKKIFN
jgi:hypothetical protein